MPEAQKAVTNNNRSLTRMMVAVALVVIPVGLVIAAIVGGLKSFAGAALGFALGAAYSGATIILLKRVLSRPPHKLLSLLLLSYFARLLALGAILYGMYLVEVPDMISVLASFLALYISHTAVEIYFALGNLKGTVGTSA